MVLVLLAALFGVGYAGFGILVALRTRNVQATNTSFLLFFPLLFLTPNFVPFDRLTPVMEALARANPVSYVIEGLRSLVIDGWDWDKLGCLRRGDRRDDRGAHRALAAGDRHVRPLNWDRLSRQYDRQLWLERRAVEAALDMAAPTPETTLLDAGTGTGAVLRALATRAGRPRHVVGVDSSAAMLARVPPLPEGWHLQRADVAALPFDDASFDAATAVYLLHVLEPATRAAALAELRRVLRPGARLVTVTSALPSRALLRPSLGRAAAPRPAPGTGRGGFQARARPHRARGLLLPLRAGAGP